MPNRDHDTVRDNYIIEIQLNGSALPAGIVVRAARGFRFFAATHAFNALEGRLFAGPQEAEKAALRYHATRARVRSAPGQQIGQAA